MKTMRYKDVIQHIFVNTGLLKNEECMDPNLAAVLVTELLWGKKLLPGQSKPIQVIMKYESELLSVINSDEVMKDEQCLPTSKKYYSSYWLKKGHKRAEKLKSEK